MRYMKKAVGIEIGVTATQEAHDHINHSAVQTKTKSDEKMGLRLDTISPPGLPALYRRRNNATVLELHGT
jgi:hypothetical protein